MANLLDVVAETIHIVVLIAEFAMEDHLFPRCGSRRRGFPRCGSRRRGTPVTLDDRARLVGVCLLGLRFPQHFKRWVLVGRDALATQLGGVHFRLDVVTEMIHILQVELAQPAGDDLILGLRCGSRMRTLFLGLLGPFCGRRGCRGLLSRGIRGLTRLMLALGFEFFGDCLFFRFRRGIQLDVQLGVGLFFGLEEGAIELGALFRKERFAEASVTQLQVA